MKIKEICEAERPRERMLSAGPSALGNSELIAILLRTGTRGDSAVELAQKLLSKCEGRLSSLFNMSSDTIRRMPGIGRHYRRCPEGQASEGIVSGHTPV